MIRKRRILLRLLGSSLITAGLVLAGATTLVGLSYLKDVRSLREQTRAVVGMASTGRSVELLNTWVYRHKGFRKNQRYFGFARLGPTFVDVLSEGGDCADKSRLLSAMLREIGIESPLATIYPCADCGPIHTVVLARSEVGWITADPTYDITFPDGSGGYTTLDILRSSDSTLIERITQLRRERGSDDKINYYDPGTFNYQNLTTKQVPAQPHVDGSCRVILVVGEFQSRSPTRCPERQRA